MQIMARLVPLARASNKYVDPKVRPDENASRAVLFWHPVKALGDLFKSIARFWHLVKAFDKEGAKGLRVFAHGEMSDFIHHR